MHEHPPDAGRPRAVADAPIDALLERDDRLARGWLAQIVAGWPLERIAQVPFAEIARDGPGICSAALGAVVDDRALRGIEHGAGLLRGMPPELSVRAVEALRRTLWAALLSELRDFDAMQLGQLADRLGHICAALAATGVEQVGATRAAPAPAPAVGPTGASAARPKPAPTVRPAPPLDEPAAVAFEPVGAPEAPFAAPAEPFAAPGPRRLREAGSAPDDDPSDQQPWLEAIGRHLEVHARDGRPFAVLLVEVDGRERLAAADLDGDVVAALARAERVLLERLRPGDQLLRDQPGRYWVIAPETDAAAAHMLAWGFAAAPQDVEGHRGVPLLFAVGIALCPNDGEHAQSLTERAEDAVMEARAAGIGVSPEPR